VGLTANEVGITASEVVIEIFLKNPMAAIIVWLESCTRRPTSGIRQCMHDKKTWNLIKSAQCQLMMQKGYHCNDMKTCYQPLILH
jgi:hypothetical protein